MNTILSQASFVERLKNKCVLVNLPNSSTIYFHLHTQACIYVNCAIFSRNYDVILQLDTSHGYSIKEAYDLYVKLVDLSNSIQG